MKPLWDMAQHRDRPGTERQIYCEIRKVFMIGMISTRRKDRRN